ncbi:MAG: EamA family transporter [Kiritimatiellae bacterium]|nr:EamA family transporter [Kiritimatiellia bacterium]MCO5068421.1 EamA family transporter [Kiritimatiellia bacterium]
MSWTFWAFLAAGFAALTAIFAKVGVANVDSDLATLLRTTVVLALLGPFVLLTGKWSNPLSLPPRTLVFLALSAIATGASWVCYFRALQAGSASLVAPLDKLSVVLVALFAFAFLGERPSPLAWLGIVLVSIGAIVIAFAAARGGA